MSSAPSPRRGLGRGLEVLIGGQPATELANLPIGLVHANPRQPRRRFDHETTAGLAESIRAQGVVQPVVVRSRREGGELIAGERRWRAAREAGLETIPAVVRESGDREALLLGLVENVAREQLTRRGGAGLRPARRRVRARSRRDRRPGRTVQAVGLEPHAPARLAGGRARDARARRAQRGHARAVLAVPTTRTGAAWPARSSSAGCPCGKPSAPPAGPAPDAGPGERPARPSIPSSPIVPGLRENASRAAPSASATAAWRLRSPTRSSSPSWSKY